MTEVRQKMRGTTAESDAYVGREGQIIYDRTRKELRVMDGVTVGGIRIYNATTIIAAVQSIIGLSTSTAYNSLRLGGVVAASYVQNTLTLTAGLGLSGGGTLAANRTFALGLNSLPAYVATPTVANARFVVHSLTAGQEVQATNTQMRTLLQVSSVAEWQARVITAGNGLTGGGALTADRTITLGTPETITSLTNNTVSATGHTHSLNLTGADLVGVLGYTPVPNSRQILAGNGLTGGGALTADRSLAIGTPGTVGAGSLNAVTSTSHTHALTLSDTDISGGLGYVPASTGTSVLAGEGLIGGGTLAGTRTIDMGVGSSVTATSINDTSASGHSHALVLTPASLNTLLGQTIVYTTTRVDAGDGLTGGGSMAADRVITLGNPTSITNSTTNVVTTTGHTHALGITVAEVYTGSTQDLTTMPLGATIIARGSISRNASSGVWLDSGNTDRYTTTSSGAAMSGTWRGRGSYTENSNPFTMMQRVA